MKPIRLTVVESTTRPGMLSIRVDPKDPTATRFYRALAESGAKVGDVLIVRSSATPSRRHRLSRVIAQFGPHDQPVLECDACGTWVSTRSRKHIYSHDNGATWTPGPDACPRRRP